MVEGGGFTAGIRGFFSRRMAQLLSLGKGGTRAERPEIRRVEMPIETNGSNATQRNGGSVDEANVSVTLEEIKNRGKLLREKLHERFGTASSRSENSLTAENDRTEGRGAASGLTGQEGPKASHTATPPIAQSPGRLHRLGAIPVSTPSERAHAPPPPPIPSISGESMLPRGSAASLKRTDSVVLRQWQLHGQGRAGAPFANGAPAIPSDTSAPRRGRLALLHRDGLSLQNVQTPAAEAIRRASPVAEQSGDGNSEERMQVKERPLGRERTGRG
ncbi:hypothetical protein [Ensifer sp. NM-2]|uniref:hypothetical protein n=1 Tax=Ensifer sp. NM-2 TaxID=2109730 RepID=UPI0011B1F982|nr:hypothetical protein [Ensifer sp. NM-2]